MRSHTLKHGDTFAVFDDNGDARAGPGSSAGIFHRDTRHLAQLDVTIGGARPSLMSSALSDDNLLFTYDLADADRLIHLRRSCLLWDAGCCERLCLRNLDQRSRRISLEVAFAADFADLFEVRGMRRARRGRRLPTALGADRVTLAYDGLDGRRRTTTLRFEPAPSHLGEAHAAIEVELAPHDACSIFLHVDCNGGVIDAGPRRAFFAGLRSTRRALGRSMARAAAITTSNALFNEAVQRSVCDLHMLITDLPEGPYPYAGVPWFSTVFGRDALITALQTLWFDPAIARGVLGHLAANQATQSDAACDAEPGKILHETRHGEMAALGEVPFRRYYGSVDATPLFVMLAGAYLQRTDDLATLQRLWPNLAAALSWIERFGDRDGDGFVEYARLGEQGLVNQGWKDSPDSIFHADGTLARGPIALAEVQAYVYGAWKAAAAIARRLGTEAAAYETRAEALRQAFDARFFDEALGTYVLALDGEKRPCRVLASNAGHALVTGIAYPHRAEQVVRTLMGARFFCGWGIRTVAAGEARYNPMSYHNGSVWPHDNALIASGFARYGFHGEAARLFEALFAASTYMDLRRLPELFCGFARRRTRGPTLYPVACTPQAWAAATPLSMLHSCIGLGFDPQAGRITCAEPVLPSFLDEVVLRNLTVGTNRLDIALHRSGTEVEVQTPTTG